MINNQLIASTITALAEGMLLADVMNLDRKLAAQVLSTVPALSPMMNLKLPNYVDNNFPLLFSLANMTKDLKLANFEAKKSNKKLHLAEKNLQLFKKGMKNGLGSEDLAAIIKTLE